MVAIVQEPHPPKPNGPRSRHEAAVLAERQRRARLKGERRRTEAARIWAEFGVAVERVDALRDIVATVVSASGEPDEAVVLRRLLDGAPSEGGPRELRRLLRAMPPLAAIPHIADLYAIGLPMVAGVGAQAALLAAAGSATPDGLASVDSDSPAWRLWRDVLLVRHGSVPMDPAGFTRAAPLAAVDDYLDNGGESVARHWSQREAAERVYLLARVDPHELTEADLLDLEWDDEIWRRRMIDAAPQPPPEDAPELTRLLYAVGAGDADALAQAAHMLPDEKAEMIGRVLDSPAHLDTWPEELVRDPGMWPALGQVWKPDAQAVPTDDHTSDFVSWCGLRDGYHMLLDLDDGAEEVFGLFERAPDPKVREEAVNMQVYLRFRFSAPTDSGVLSWGESRLRNLGRGNPTLAANLRWIAERKAASVNDREPVPNPYLELGVHHGAPAAEWQSAWRALRRKLRGNTGDLSDINLARDRLRDMETAGGLGQHRFFQVPLDQGFLLPQPRIPRCLVPEGTILTRRTPPLRDVDVERLRAVAADDLLTRMQ
ncbi:hypothetical protein HDA32_001146 [Spinactinospora alkalitolerans]|uniref:Uncharacterized protein n=1 Tax=Spinactinospora alkalitolerans TaxID=687207 RepID=A0A852TNU1_9ACTN|nr:hypothetical protein [Spinactinospora alkalitolerans]NYE46026.1 hypothetical protein [Spinactinospora alkalitolerans]